MKKRGQYDDLNITIRLTLRDPDRISVDAHGVFCVVAACICAKKILYIDNRVFDQCFIHFLIHAFI